MELFRGLADDELLDDWLQHTIFPAEAMNVDEAFVRCGTRLGVAELIRGGITTVCDMYYYEMAVAEELAAAGLRGLLGQVLIDFPAPDAADHAGRQDLGKRSADAVSAREQCAHLPSPWQEAAGERRAGDEVARQ
jgi:5-methylthioadenosine/S-adenosylhomocysteine deaminase